MGLKFIRSIHKASKGKTKKQKATHKTTSYSFPELPMKSNSHNVTLLNFPQPREARNKYELFQEPTLIAPNLKNSKGYIDSQNVLRKEENGRKNNFLIFGFIT